MINAQRYLIQNYPDKNNKHIDLSGWDQEEWIEKTNWNKLIGELDLSDYPNLEKLDCSYNKITSLNLVNCSKLTELHCWGNELTEINFPPRHLKLKTLHAWTNELTEINWGSFDAQSLIKISISNNNLNERKSRVFHRFVNLEELYIGNDVLIRLEERKSNRFSGSLKTLLENCKQLKKLQIEQTGIEEDIKILPKELKIVSWHKQNDTIARIISAERLYVIRNNIIQFINKWKEMKKLNRPDEFSKQWWLIKGIQWANRASSVAGGSLLLFLNCPKIPINSL